MGWGAGVEGEVISAARNRAATVRERKTHSFVGHARSGKAVARKKAGKTAVLQIRTCCKMSG